MQSIVRDVPSLKRFAWALVAITILAGSASAQSRDDGRTYVVSTTRLKQLSALTAGDVQKGQIPGVVILVARNGKVVHADAIGVQDPKTGTPMKMDSIFRIASMTKPLVTVGALTLLEEGRSDSAP